MSCNLIMMINLILLFAIWNCVILMLAMLYYHLYFAISIGKLLMFIYLNKKQLLILIFMENMWILFSSSWQGEATSAQLIGQAISSNPAFLALRQIESAREIAHTIANSSNRVFLQSDDLLLNLHELNFDGKATLKKWEAWFVCFLYAICLYWESPTPYLFSENQKFHVEIVNLPSRNLHGSAFMFFSCGI